MWIISDILILKRSFQVILLVLDGKLVKVPSQRDTSNYLNPAKILFRFCKDDNEKAHINIR